MFVSRETPEILQSVMSGDHKINVIIADSQFLIVESLRSLLSGSGLYSILGVALSKQDLCRLLQDTGRVILITDPQWLNYSGTDELRKILHDYPLTSILILAQVITKSDLVELRKAGIDNILLKTTGKEELFAAMDATWKGKKYFTPDLFDMLIEKSERLQAEEESRSLTHSEIEIVRMIANGHTTKEIAKQRNVSFHTVNTHRKNIFRKLGVNNATELVRYAIRAGWIDAIEYYI